MTLLYYHPDFLDHQTGNHPEQAERLRAVFAQLERRQLDQRCTRTDWNAASLERLARVHQLEYCQNVQQLDKCGGGKLGTDTLVGPQSFDIARLATGAVCDAVERVVRGEDNRALCLVRPPGHHARKSAAMGFCLFNHIAVAAQLATHELDVQRVLIVDWDVHHGNGTQETFWKDPQVGFFSIHRWPFYPGTGAADEIGEGPGRGTTKNVPVPMGTSRDRYLSQFTHTLENFSDLMKPELILISAGFDSHREDPIGSLGLETEDFGHLTAAVEDVAQTHAQGRLVSVLEGGYNPPVLAECVQIHLTKLQEADL